MPEKNVSYVFNDTETTGLNINFSQIIQIGSILTSENFDQIDTIDDECQILPWIVPDPGAYFTHKKISTLNSNCNKTHYDLIKEIHSTWMQWSDSSNLVHITYNGHKFDEELLRRQFYWYLLDPYITNTNNNGRADMYVLFQLLANFYSDEIKTGKNENGDLSLKLSDLAEANGISAEGAHDALEDCILMVELGKIIKDKAPEAWKIFIQGSSKKGNLDILRSEKFCLLGEVLRRNKYVYPIYPCGQNNSNQNQIIVCDLYFNPEELFKLKDHELLEQLGTQGGAFKLVSINKSMPVTPLSSISKPSSYLDLSIKELTRRANLLKENFEFSERLSELLIKKQKSYPPPKYVDQAIYERFPSDSDRLWMEKFHISTWQDKTKLKEGFEDSRYRELASRIIALEKPDLLSDDENEDFSQFINERLFTKGPWLNLSQAIQKLEKYDSDDSDHLKIKNALKEHLQNLEKTNLA